MYKNIGGKIKLLAIVDFASVTIVSIASALYLIYLNEDFIKLGLLIILIGPTAAWISSLLLYGFGELIDKATEIERNTSTYKKSYPSNSFKNYPKQKISSNKKAQSDKNSYHNITCPNCSEKLYYLDSEFRANENVTCPYCDFEFKAG